jgi:hypothetical protein
VKKASQKAMIGQPVDHLGEGTNLSKRIAARLQYLDDDPLDFWDYGMLCAFEIIEGRIREMTKEGRELVSLKDVLKVIAVEQRIVESESLHFFCQMAESTDVKQDRSRGTPSQKARGVRRRGNLLVKAAAAGMD